MSASASSTRIAVAAFAMLALASSATAQRYFLNNGQTLTAADVQLRGTNLVQTLTVPGGGGTAESLYPVANVVRIEFPVPPELEEAQTLIGNGSAAAAVTKLEPVLRQFSLFAKVPGSYWPDAALLRTRALLLQGQKEEAARAAQGIVSAGVAPEIALRARMILVQLDLEAGRIDAVNAAIKDLESAPTVSDEIRARIWIVRGDLALKRSEFTEALEAYLRVPAFYGTQDELMPAAFLGSIRAYRGYGDNDRAERAALELIDTYPTTPEAAAAKKENVR